MKLGRLAVSGGAATEFSGIMFAARAEKKPAPWGGSWGGSVSADELWAGEAGAEGGPLPLRLGWLRTRFIGAAWAGRDSGGGGRMLALEVLVVRKKPLLPLGVWG